MYPLQFCSADAECAPWAAAQGTALRAVKVLSSRQILPAALIISLQTATDQSSLTAAAAVT